MRNLIDTAFPRYRMTELNEAYGIHEADDMRFDDVELGEAYREICSIRRADK